MGTESSVLKVLHWGESCKVVVGSEVVVFVDDFLELAPYVCDVFVRGLDLVIEFLLDGSVCALDAAVVLWAGGWDDEEGDVELCAGLFEFSSELGSAIDLDGFDFEGDCLDHLDEEAFCGCAFGVAVEIGEEEFGASVPSLEELVCSSVYFDCGLVDLDILSDCGLAVFLEGLSLCVSVSDLSSPSCWSCA